MLPKAPTFRVTQFSVQSRRRAVSIGKGLDFIGQRNWGIIFPLQKIGYFNRLQ
jgi:hypothetical protein